MNINLLPWRITQHQKQTKRFGIMLFAYALPFVFGYNFFSQLTEQGNQKLSQYQENLQQINQHISQVQQDIGKIQQRHSPMHKTAPLASMQITKLFTLLDELPLSQGELQALRLDIDGLWFQGTTETHQEFEQIHQFLQQQAEFSPIKLVQFKPQATHIFFEFQTESTSEKGKVK